jgi:hypothetical protein
MVFGAEVTGIVFGTVAFLGGGGKGGGLGGDDEEHTPQSKAEPATA